MNANSSTTSEWLKAATKLLESNGIGTARLDCLVLLEDSTGKERSWLLAHPEHELTPMQIKFLNRKIERRARHIPLSYVRGKTEFYGREFIITDAVLEPRPESETMIDLLKELKPDGKIMDIGTGSGALAVTAKLELPDCKVIATDIDVKCLVVARQNAAKYKQVIQFMHGTLLKALPPNFHDPETQEVILANLPYVPDDFAVNEAAMNEPHIAIFGGSDGLDLYRTLFRQIADDPQFKGYVLTESLPFQHKALQGIAENAGCHLVKAADFIQVFAVSPSSS